LGAHVALRRRARFEARSSRSDGDRYRHNLVGSNSDDDDDDDDVSAEHPDRDIGHRGHIASNGNSIVAV
jgi:hypothetical protein